MNKKVLFHEPEDFRHFRSLLIEYRNAHLQGVYRYCFMTNHAHLLIKAPRPEELSKFSHYVQRRYAYYYCGKYKWTGSVFQRGYRSMVIDRDEYLLECGRYIERNPLKAGLVKAPEMYPYTSYRYYTMGEADDLVTESPAYLGLSVVAEERRTMYSGYVKQVRIQDEMVEKGLLAV
jgi:putative transposase